jgi:hypothetical protein
MNASIVGALILAVPAMIVAWAVLWRRYRPVLWSVIAMIVVATGYLVATGAARDVGLRFGGPFVSEPAPAR